MCLQKSTIKKNLQVVFFSLSCQYHKRRNKNNGSIFFSLKIRCTIPSCKLFETMELSDDWEAFLSHQPLKKCAATVVGKVPDSSPIYVSTKTYILYMSNGKLDLWEMFWGLPVIPYAEPVEGVIEKQMKLQSKSAEEVDAIAVLLQQYEYSSAHIMVHTETATEFKDIRKVTIGLSKKALRANRPKINGAFYNCFVTIVRIRIESGFREFHVKVFNTGKVEIPGIQSDDHLRQVIEVLTASMNRVMYITAVPHSEEIVLINSNFNCNYFIHRDKLYEVLRRQFGVAAIYDPCSYPGIQCKLYTFEDKVFMAPVDGGFCVSVMIFRTGSILIVGKCEVATLQVVYDYLTTIFKDEYATIMDPNCVHAVKKTPKQKRIKRIIQLSKKS